ncbi:PREDICTED: uncharacterized protein LOC104698998 [Camelina sativa]|uniref:Uncharacterized protein LOC104698998 n=1 Tax=Camelina sativa TaxID=90675 RepID=A0ABM0SKV8_CAMSA|nr:PREDICTED: uncharacterized protein LOC104698998 [Camelina sativa]
MQEMEAMFQKVTSKAPEVDLVLEATQRTPFPKRLAMTPVRRLVKPRLSYYDGTADPRDFLHTFGVSLGPLQFSPEEYDAKICQIFAEHLTGTALSWFLRLPSWSIDSIKDLITEFLKQFSALMENKNSHADLYALTQERQEPLWSFIRRFKEIVANVSIPDVAAIVTLGNALWYESRFKEELSLTHVETIADALLRGAKHIELKEEKDVDAKKHTKAKTTVIKEPTIIAPKIEHTEPRQHFTRNQDRTRRTFLIADDVQQKQPWNVYVRREGGESITTQYCDYHQSSTHATEDCRYLQMILMERYKKGAIVFESDRSKMPRPRKNNPKRGETAARKFESKNSKILDDQSEDELGASDDVTHEK